MASSLILVLLSPYWWMACWLMGHGGFQGLRRVDQWALEQAHLWLSEKPAPVEVPLFTPTFLNGSAAIDFAAMDDGVAAEARQLQASSTRTARFARPENEEPSDEDQMDVGIASAASVIIGMVFFIAIECCVACCYKSGVTDRRDAFVDPAPGTEFHLGTAGDFKYGICGCFEDCQNCLHGWCCAFQRAADTYQAAGVNSYWTIFMVAISCYAVGEVVEAVLALVSAGGAGRSDPGLLVFGILWAMYMGGQRANLKRKLGAPNPNCCTECCCWLWCSLCLVCQEARQVDKINNAGPVCCLSLLKTAPPQPAPVGGAVVVGQVVQAPVIQGQVVGTSEKNPNMTA